MSNLDAANANISQAYAYLEDTQQAPKIASLGWCFGGTWSLNTALLFPESLDAAVIYYGGGITTDPEQLATLEMPIIGFFGADDTNPTPETVAEFERVLKALDKSVEVHLYEGAGHAFANPSGTRYVEAAAMDAWEKTIEFLNEKL
jgi:carboxymethylenebutenolidase